MSSDYYEPVAGSPRPLSGCVPTFTSMDISPLCRLPPAATVLVPSEETIRQESQPQRRSYCQSQDSAGWNLLPQLPGVDHLFLHIHRQALPRCSRCAPSQRFSTSIHPQGGFASGVKWLCQDLLLIRQVEQSWCKKPTATLRSHNLPWVRSFILFLLPRG